MGKERISREDFERIFATVPRLTIDLVIKNSNGILFTKRTIEPQMGEWHLPGGSVFFNETIDEAVKRKAKEELNLDVDSKKLLGYIEYINENDGNINRHSIAMVFLIEIENEKIVLNDEANEFVFSKKTPENMFPEQKEFLKKRNHLFE